ncbi:MAG TPA: TlpA disulfide reductase family protein [Candidatus Acidoferrum sp.]|nr:TlpA disulfide reductase family protein [Candidatus Acidoferrum sp.]
MLACALLFCAAAAKDKDHPDVSLKDSSGAKHSIADYRGKVLVLNFWATWCGPCREELPMLNAVAKQYAPKGVVFVEASLDDKQDEKKIPAFLAKEGVDLPVWIGADPATLKKLNLGKIIPATLLIDRDGRAVARLLGEARHDELTARLDWILAGEPDPAPASVVRHY